MSKADFSKTTAFAVGIYFNMSFPRLFLNLNLIKSIIFINVLTRVLTDGRRVPIDTAQSVAQEPAETGHDGKSTQPSSMVLWETLQH